MRAPRVDTWFWNRCERCDRLVSALNVVPSTCLSCGVAGERYGYQPIQGGVSGG